MKYAAVFLLFGLVCAYSAWMSQVLALQVLGGCFGVAFCGVGLAYLGVGQRAFLKQPDGRLHLLSYVLYWPYHLLNGISLWGFRRAGKENAFDKINENLYLGCRLGRRDEAAIGQLGLKSVLDLTCEFGELPLLRGLSYRCIPILDTRAPSLEALRDGAEWVRAEAAKGPVYVHCALGHGRSAIFVAAYLLLTDKATTAAEAVGTLQQLRPRVGLHAEQVRLLERMASSGQ